MKAHRPEAGERSLPALRVLAARIVTDLRLATRNVLRHRRRSAIALGAVAAGVAGLLLASGFFEWTYQSIRESTIRGRIGHLQIVRPGYRDSGTADPFRFMLPEAAPEMQAIAAMPQVSVVAPRLSFNGLISMGDTTASFLGEGVDPAAERTLSGALRIVRGEALVPEDPTGIIVGEGLARTLGLDTGAQIVLVANTSTGAMNATDAHVRGIFATSTKAYDDYALRMPLSTAQKLLRTTGVHAWLVLLRDTGDTDAVAAALRARLDPKAFEIVPWYRTPVADFYNKVVTLFSQQVLVLKIMIGVIIVLSISNTMMTSVRERIGEIGTGMALGDRRSTVLRRFIAEGLVTGVVGGVLGAALGIALARLITWIGIPMPPPPGMAAGYLAGIVVTPRLVLDGVALAAITAMLAGVHPAWRASRMNIVDALRQAR